MLEVLKVLFATSVGVNSAIEAAVAADPPVTPEAIGALFDLGHSILTAAQAVAGGVSPPPPPPPPEPGARSRPR